MDTKSPEIVNYVQKKLLARLAVIAKGDRSVFSNKAGSFIA